MKSYVDDIVVTDPNGEKAILYPNTKQEAVEGLLERLANVEKLDITETTAFTMPNSYDGRLLVEEIGGVCEQGANPSPTNPQEIKKSVISEIRTHDGNGNEYAITLSHPIDLYHKGNVQDVIEDGKVKQRFKKDVFDGSNDEMWVTSSLKAGRYYVDGLPNSKLLGSAYCTHSIHNKWVTDVVNNSYFSESVSGRFIINTSFATLDEWKAHLAENPMTVVYEMAEEVIEELPLADQIALNSLSTYDGITYLEFDSEIEPTFKGEYGTSKVGGYTLEGMLAGRNGELYGKRVETLEATVVNNI